MSNWEKFVQEEPGSKHHSKFNKERFCKKNRLTHRINGSNYGPHNYSEETGCCIYCQKIDPRTKRSHYNGN